MVMNYNKKTSDNKVKVVTEHTDWLMNTKLELPDNQHVSVIIFTPNESYYQPRVNNECLSHRFSFTVEFLVFKINCHFDECFFDKCKSSINCKFPGFYLRIVTG